MNMFIPPEGAMQFEFLHSRRPEVSGHLEGQAFWVKAYHRTVSDPLCACDGWQIITESLPSHLREITERRISVVGKVPIVCSCVGRIIE